MKLIPKKSFELSLILLISCFSSIITDQITDPFLIRSSTITSVHLNNNNHTLSNQSILIRSIRDHHHLDVQSSSRENNHRKPFSFIERIKLDQDFKPKFRGQIIPGYRLNLTDLAKRIPNEPDYYDLDEFDDYDDIVDSEASDLSSKNISNQIDPKDSIDEITSSSMASSSLETTESSNISDSISISTSNDMDKTIGGFVGIIEKILLGPKPTEINETSSLEDVYAYLDQIVQEQFSKAFKSIIRRFYDNRLLFDQNLSQRCFNSFAQFGDRLRKNYQWPMKMLGASADFFSTRFSLRNYGDFDGCLSIDAEDDEHSPREIFFTGQYCLVQLLLPMPPVTKFLKLRIYEKIFDFDKISIDNRSTFVKNYLQNSPLFYSNPPSYGLCLPSVCSSNELEIAINQGLRKNSPIFRALSLSLTYL
ncbi:hypothetical protein NH340_JMT07640 [Sarcoptes scabiei]|nr:hypothetical protein NH340_JMT07640 [Sarcoptes scabiei]